MDNAHFNKKIDFSNAYMEFERNQVLKNLVSTSCNSEMAAILVAILVKVHRTKYLFELGREICKSMVHLTTKETLHILCVNFLAVNEYDAHLTFCV